MLARWWGWAPGDTDSLTIREWKEAVEDAAEQIEAQNKALGK